MQKWQKVSDRKISYGNILFLERTSDRNQFTPFFIVGHADGMKFRWEKYLEEKLMNQSDGYGIRM